MSEITCDNFYTELPVIEEAIRKSAFVCLDMEYSKLHENVSNPFSSFDSIEERYCKLKEKVSDITCIQFGLSTFCHDSNTKTFKAKSYSFFTYPQTFYICDSVVNFQTSSVEFLCKHNFDFNKLFYKSVPYLTDEEEVAIESEMQNPFFFDRYFEINSKFRAIEQELHKVLNSVSEWYYKKGEDTLVIRTNGNNDHVYIILMQYYVMKQFKYVSVNQDEKGLIVTKIDEKKALESLNDQIYENLKLSLLHKMLGIKHVLKLLSKLKKPIVGHNCALDILILCQQFFIPLPESFIDYKHFMHYNFGPIYDTKLIGEEIKQLQYKHGGNWLGSSLSELYYYLKDGQNIVYSNLMSVKSADEVDGQNMHFHHAGWDAYYTGFCFVQMIQIIKKKSTKNKDLTDRVYTLTELYKSVEFSKNKLYTYRSMAKSLDLDPNDPQIEINCYFVIQNRGILFRKLDLKKLKIDLQEIGNHIDIKPISKHCALIAPPTISSFNRIISGLESKYVIEKYSNYKNRVLKQRIAVFTLGIMCTTIAALTYLKKH